MICRLALFSGSIILLGTASFLLSLNGCGGGNSSPSTVSGSNKIQHVVIIFQENRTPDNLFQGLCISPYGSPSACSTNPSATQYNIQTSNWLNNQSSGGVTQPGMIDLGTVGSSPDNYDLNHAHAAFLEMCDMNISTNTCVMDGAAGVSVGCTSGAANCPPTNPQFMYVNPADVQSYLQMAHAYTFGDQMFQTNQGPSFPAHQFILSGTSAPATGSSYFVADNPAGVPSASANTNCTAPSAEYVDEINSTDPPGSDTETPIFPCLDHQTLTDLLDAANLSWRYYAPSLGSLWTAPAAINHMCVPSPAPPNATACTGPDFTATSPKVVLNQSQSNAQILSDIASNHLQTVSWIIPDGDDSDHAKSNNGCGPSWVTSIVNAIGNSSYWSNTAIIITWDDWGGWYDHVGPQVINSYEYGFRVPIMVISPYIVKAGYISHVTHNFGSIVKFVESTFNLPSMGYADATSDELSDFFNFSQSPTAFQSITPPTDNATCQGDTNGPSDPDDD